MRRTAGTVSRVSWAHLALARLPRGAHALACEDDSALAHGILAPPMTFAAVVRPAA